ncbi:MAG TPA: formimidoylglutamate deiminase, partial [Pyrinomonadaceae bacterium]|nr:formimidoylglutamate deiminase [Pyrinomonadaceae bacterium]
DGAGAREAVTWVPDSIYLDGRFERGRALVTDRDGRVLAVPRLPEELMSLPGESDSIALPEEGLVVACRFVRLRNRALLPGLVNAHSHAFQRVIRGRTEHRAAASSRDSFWTWREAMYDAAARLTPEDIYDASRMAFVEMLLSGVTAVGEFHYLHRTPAGAAYDDPNLLAKEVVRAARDVGLRVALLRVFYARSGFRTPPNERQRRFIEADPAVYVRHTEALMRDLRQAAEADGPAAGGAWAGVAPHSVRAVRPEHLRAASAFADAHGLPLHMHVAEQPAEVAACVAETGRTPVALLADEGVLSARFTGVHAVHITAEEARALARAGAMVCACPTTERNLGDGVVPADLLFAAGVAVSLGTDSHTQIDLLEDARELEYHLRLVRVERNVLAPEANEAAGENEAAGRAANVSALAARLFECATTSGARSIGAAGGALEPGRPADFFTVDVDDPSIAGARDEDLLPAVVFSLSRTAVREVAVGGRLVVEEGRHRAQEEIVSRFAALQRKLWR